MELELGLKITRTREDVSSSVDFRFSKDPFGPLLLSRETDSRFIVIIHLKGFKKEGIEIDINKEGNRITISGRKPVEEMVLVRWMAWRKEVELRAFRKVFRIPDIVDLDKIKARFDEDDMTLTITMPKRVKGISGFKIEEEEEEERVDFGDVSEIDAREELESIEREESDEHLETFEESQGEEFGEMMENERESEVLEDEAKGFNGGLEEEEEAGAEIGEGVTGQEEIEEVKKGKTVDTDAKSEDDRNVQKTEEEGWYEPQRSEKQEKILESIEEEDVGEQRLEEQEMVTSNTESEDSGIRKLRDIEGLDSHEQTRHDEEQENKQKLMEQQVLEAGTKSDDIGTRTFEEIEQQEPGELERICDQRKGGEMKKKIEKNEDAIEEIDAKLSKRVKENIERALVQGEEDIVESDLEADEQKRHEKQERIKELVEEETSEAETKIVKDTRKPVQETEKPEVDKSERHEGKDKIKKIEYEIDDDDGSRKVQGFEAQEPGEPERRKEEIKTQEMVKEETSHQGKGGEEQTEIENEIFKEDVDLETGERVTENRERTQLQGEEVIAETETKAEADTSEKWHEFDKLEASEIGKIHELVEEEITNQEEEEKQRVGAKNEGSSLLKLEEIEEQQQPKGQKRHEKEEKVKELIEHKILEAEIRTDTPKPGQEIAVPEKDMVERYEGKHKIQEQVQKEPSNQQEENKEKIIETGKKTNDAGEKRVEEINQQELEVPRCEEESVTQDLVKRRTNGEENEEEGIAEEIAAKETKGADDISRQEEIEKVEEDKTAETDAKTEDDGKVHKTEEQGWSEPQRNEKQEKILEDIEEEEVVGQQKSEEEEMVTSNTESEDSGLRKLPDIEGRDSLEQKRHDEDQEKNQELVEQQVSEAETKSDDIGSRAFEETGKQEPDELERTSKSGGEKEKVGAREKSMNDDSSSKVQEPVEGETGDEGKGREEKNKIEKTEIKNEDATEEIDAKMGKGAKENIERTQVQEKEDIAEVEGDVSEKWNVFDELDADELVDKREEEEEVGKDGTKSEDNSSIKLQENEEKQERIKELVEERTSEAETKIVNDTRKPVQETEEPEVDRSEIHEGKDKIKKMEYKMDDDDGSSKVQGFEAQESSEPEVKEESKTQQMVERETSHQGKGGKEKKREIENEISKEDVDLKTDEGVPKNIERRKQVREEEDIVEIETKIEADTSEKWHDFDKLEASETDKIHELVEEEMTNQEEEEKQGVKEEIAKVGAKSEGSNILKLEGIEEQQSKGQKHHEKQEQVKELIEQQTLEAEIENVTTKPVQEIAVPEKDMGEIYEGKDKTQEHVQEETSNYQVENEEKIIETGKKTNDAGEKRVQEIKQQELDGPRCEEDRMTQDLVKRQINGEENEEEGIAEEIVEEIAKKETKGEDDISRKVGDTEQRDSDAEKGEKEVGEENVCDEGKRGTAATETVTDNDKSNKVQEIDKQEPHEIGDTIQAHYQDEQEEGMKDRAETRGIVANTEDDRPKKIKGVTEQELVNLNNQLKQDNIEDQEKTQDMVEKKTTDCKEEEVRKDKGSEEPKTKTEDDDVVREVQGIEDHEMYEPKRHHLSEMQKLVEMKTGEKEEEKETTESEMEAEYGSLRKVPGIEEQELPEPNIHKERDKFRMDGKEEPIGQEKEEGENKKTIVFDTITENDNALNAKKTKEEQSNKPEYSTSKKGHSDNKEEKQLEKVIAKTEQQEESQDARAKKVQEIGKQEYDKLKRSMLQVKMRETEGKDKTGAMEEKEILERGLKNKGGDLRKAQDGEDPELGKPKERVDERKIQKLVQMEKCDRIEEVRKKDEDDRLGSQEADIADIDDFERQGEQSSIPQLVEEKMENIDEPVFKMKDDSSGKFDKLEKQKSYEDWTKEDQEKNENLVKEETTDLRVKHTGGGYEEEKYEKVTEAKTKFEDDIYKKVRENEDQGLDMKKRYIEKIEELKGKGTSDHKKKEEDFTGKIQETESDRHWKLDMIQEFMEDETGDQEDEEVKEDRDVVTKIEEAVNDNLKPVQDIKEPNVDLSERHESKYKSQELNQVETIGQQVEKKEKLVESEKKSSDFSGREVQEIRQKEPDESTRCVETSTTQELIKSKINHEEKVKEIRAGAEEKEREPFRPKILREQDKIQELVEEKTSFCKEEFAEKETKGKADMSRKDLEQLDSDAIKGVEEEDKIQELVEELCDAGKPTIAEEGKLAENDKTRNVKEMNEQESREVDAFHKPVKFPKLTGGEISGSGDNEEEENKKMTTEADKKIMDSAREVEEIVINESNVSGEHEKGDKMKELQEEQRENYQDEHEEPKDEEGKVVNTEDDGPEKITGGSEQELVNQDSQLEQVNIEEQREKTEKLVEEKIKDWKEKEVRKDKGSEESKGKTDDNVSKKVQELVDEKTGEAECSSLRKEHGNEKHEFDEQNIYKEQDKIRIAEAEEPIGQEKENDEKEKTAEPDSKNLTNVQEIKEDRSPPKTENHQKQYKIQELVEAGHIGLKEKQQREKGIPKEVMETEKQECEQQKFDDLKRAMVIDKMQETGEEDKTRAMEEKETVERGRKTEDGSLRKVRDGEDEGLGKPKRHEEEDKIQELAEMERSGYREEVKRRDKDDILRDQKGSSPDLNEFKNNILQLVEEENMERIAEPEEKMEADKSGNFHEFEERKSYEDWTDEEQEKITSLVKEEATDPKDKHTGGGEENPVIDFTGKIQETGKEESHESERHEKLDMVQEVLEEKSVDQKDEGAEESAIGSSRKVRTIEEPEKQKEEIKVKTRDLEEKVEEEGRVALKETGREVPSSSEQRKTIETMPRERRKTKIDDRVEEVEGKLVTELNGSKIPKVEDVEERESYQPEKLVEPEMEDERLEDYDTSRREKRGQKTKTSRIPEDATKANDDSSTQNETTGKKTKENHQELMERETRDQRAEQKEYVEKVETEAEHDSSRKIHETEEQKSEGKTSGCKEENEENRAGAVCGEGEPKIRDGGIGEIKEEELSIAARYREQDKKQSLVENDISSKAKETKNQETKRIADSSRMIQDIKNQEPDEQKRVAEQRKNQELVEQKTNDGRNQEDTKEDKETTDADDTREVKEIGKQESPEVKTYENITTESMTKEDPESKVHERLREKDKMKKLVQHKTDNLESSKKQEIREQETSDPRMLKEQERIKEKDNKETESESESDSLQKVQEIDKEDSIQELLDRETSEDDEEELEIEFEDEEEEWEAEVIQEMDSDEENDKIREIKRIKLGFRLVGGSALFTSLIVIVIRFIHSKKKIKPNKF